MKRIVPLAFLFFFTTAYTGSHAQTSGKLAALDSVTRALIATLPKEKQAEYETLLNNASAADRKSLISLLHEKPQGKEAMIANLDSNYDNILALKTRYQELVPKDYQVLIEFRQDEHYGEVYDLTIRRLGGTRKIDPDIRYSGHGPGDNRVIGEIPGWNYNTIMQIRKLLKAANCISIQNGEITTIGFCRNVSGSYLFSFFPKDLTAAEQNKFNDQLHYFLYHKNIVLEIRKEFKDSPVIKEPE